jgi:hypothetical protein
MHQLLLRAKPAPPNSRVAKKNTQTIEKLESDAKTITPLRQPGGAAGQRPA